LQQQDEVVGAVKGAVEGDKKQQRLMREDLPDCEQT